MNNPIQARRLSKAFRHQDAVRSLDLEVPAGSIYGLIGPNGAGKTTTIKLLMNILRPSAGSMEILGVDSRRLGPSQFARIGYVSENQEMPDEMTVDYFLRYLRPFYPTWDDALAAEMARQFELPGKQRTRHGEGAADCRLHLRSVCGVGCSYPGRSRIAAFSLAALLDRQMALACLFLLPACALAAVTRHMVECFVVAIAVVTGAAFFFSNGGKLAWWYVLGWIPAYLAGATLLPACLGVYQKQFARRDTTLSRMVEWSQN